MAAAVLQRAALRQRPAGLARQQHAGRSAADGARRAAPGSPEFLAWPRSRIKPGAGLTLTGSRHASGSAGVTPPRFLAGRALRARRHGARTRSRSGPTSPPMLSCASWNRSRAVPRTGLIRASRAVILIVAAGKAGVVAGGRVRGQGPRRRWFVGRACACSCWLIGVTATTRGYRP
jgi:hypothetical protein